MVGMAGIMPSQLPEATEQPSSFARPDSCGWLFPHERLWN